MTTTTINFPDALLVEVDKIVTSRKSKKLQNGVRKRVIATPMQIAKAHQISATQGIAAANKYLDEVQPWATALRIAASRGAVIAELVEFALANKTWVDMSPTPSTQVAQSKLQRAKKSTLA